MTILLAIIGGLIGGCALIAGCMAVLKFLMRKSDEIEPLQEAYGDVPMWHPLGSGQNLGVPRS